MLLLAAGGALAWFVAEASVAQPGVGYEPSRPMLTPVIVALIIVYLVQREIGVRLRSLPRRGWGILAGATVVTLTTFSVSLALVSLDLRWWTLVPIAVTWALGTWAAAALLACCKRALM